jgi:hypothetical protein
MDCFELRVNYATEWPSDETDSSDITAISQVLNNERVVEEPLPGDTAGKLLQRWRRGGDKPAPALGLHHRLNSVAPLGA